MPTNSVRSLGAGGIAALKRATECVLATGLHPGGETAPSRDLSERLGLRGCCADARSRTAVSAVDQFLLGACHSRAILDRPIVDWSWV